MLRRDFLRTLAAFAATASAGGTAVAAASRPASVGSYLTADGIRVPAEPVITPRTLAAAPLDLTLTRGDDVNLCIAGLMRYQGVNWAAVIHGIGSGPPVYGLVMPGTDTLWLRFDGRNTRRLRPGPRPWHLAFDDRVALAGTATILPDELWTAEESVLGLVPQMYPVALFEKRRGGYEVGFRAKLKDAERSPYDDRVASLVEHCRPVYAEIINRGQGCRIDFAHKGLL